MVALVVVHLFCLDVTLQRHAMQHQEAKSSSGRQQSPIGLQLGVEHVPVDSGGGGAGKNSNYGACLQQQDPSAITTQATTRYPYVHLFLFNIFISVPPETM